ncbi:DUF1501 domain-containing protein [Enhygromyxa salina]|uniref:Tat (Twin-arginine translocation) pathway signal sequence domain protein n=1 Tax=Enhygromyxa salina TaxID=215803 RepID=A0A2S9YXU5_9BACT|nr:DUF1501 domain-containing protein [Enhygromyxa salina]PRQ09892.1 hypothetical protein ENSA7_03730 [Enhygromyxa salina]
MNRRDFFKLAGLAGLTLIPGSSAATLGGVAGQPQTPRAYAGTFWIFVNAGGGWDPTSMCDPKGRANEMEVDPMNMYLSGDILSAGNISYAPVGYNDTFFQKYYQDLLIINGLDMQTNGHDSGSRHVWSGRLIEGFPSIAALVAANSGPELPMSYLSFGGYDETAGLVARTRSGNVNALGRIAYPDRFDPNNADDRFHSVKAGELIQSARDGRRTTQELTATLPAEQIAMNQMFTATDGANELKLLQQYLPAELANDNQLRRQAQVALAAYRAGISIAVNLNVGGFDTHGDHDNQHIPRLASLLEGVDAIWQEAEAQQVADNVVVVVGSDFGRTPGYNPNNGKDHWSVSSMMLMGKGIKGNRVVGGSTDRHQPLKVDPNSLALSESGVRIEPQHVHYELRKLAGLDGGDFAAMFPLNPPQPMSKLLGG